MAHLFLSYRREDAGYVAGLLAERLRQAFGPGSVFMDVDTIPLGVDFRAHVQEAVARCDVLLALVGDGWLTTRRIDDPGDLVRVEIETALARGIPVVPVLVGKARMPAPEDLPPSLEPLAFRNATELRSGRDLEHHVEVLIAGLRESLREGSHRKEWSATYEGHRIRVTNWWGLGATPTLLKGGARLYVDDACVDESNAERRKLTATVRDRGGVDHALEVRFGGFLTVKARILVDGRQVGGDP
jgi:hypothetical protein